MSWQRKGCLITLVVLVVLMLVGLRSCGFFRGSYYWQQKITIEVETPQGVLSASSVVAIKAEPYSSFSGNHYRYKPTGEAVVLELPMGEGKTSRWLFALLLDDPTGFGLWNIYEKEAVAISAKLGAPDGKKVSPYRLVDDLKAYPPAQLKPENYPMLVTFTNINDPKSAKLVNPADLVASFGPGYSLKSITLKITDEPVTEGRVDKVLGWVRNLRPNQLDGQKYESSNTKYSFANSLTVGNFTTERFE